MSARSLRKLPKYRLHRGSGQALVEIAGRRTYLGKFDSPESHERYRRVVAEWVTTGGVASAIQRSRGTQNRSGLTIAELSIQYLTWAEGYYRKNGQVTPHVARIKGVLKLLRELYGRAEAASFGPLALRAVQQKLIERGNCRSHINALTSDIKRLFKWAASYEILGITIYEALRSVPGLKRGRTAARESAPVRPVSDERLALTLPHLPPVIRDMVRIQRLLGCRPGELCSMRPGEIDRTGPVWVYEPAEHKTEIYNKSRRIFIGPRAQAILGPYLDRPSDAFCFSPKECDERRKALMRESRKTPVQPSQVDRRKRRPKCKPGDRYEKDAYNRAIRRACTQAAGLVRPSRPKQPELLDAYRAELANFNEALRSVRWSPNQLRHSAATEIRRQFGLEAAQTVLGHSRADVTQVYAERDCALAARVAAEIG